MVLLKNHLEEQEKMRAALEHERAVNANLLLEFQKRMADQALQATSFINSLRDEKTKSEEGLKHEMQSMQVQVMQRMTMAEQQQRADRE